MKKLFLYSRKKTIIKDVLFKNIMYESGSVWKGD